MEKITVMVIDGGGSFEELSQHLNKNVFTVIAVTSNGHEGLRYCLQFRPKILITDILLPGMDGYQIIAEVKKALPETKILVTSALRQDSFVNRAFVAGADNYLLKPVDLSLLEDRLLEMLTGGPGAGERSAARSLDERLGNIFISIGIPAHIKGYQFLREAVKVSMNAPETISSITKTLYPSVATKFDTTPSKVERAIRHAIEVAWNRGKIENLNMLFGVKIYSAQDKPTNGEFIALLSDKMLIESDR